MAISLTERAANEIKTIVEQQQMSEAAVLKVGVKGGGCSGFAYSLDLATEPAEKDKVFEMHGVTVACDPKSYLYLNGIEIDFKDEIMGRGFTFNNPNATSSCGCGSSFQA